MAVTPARGAPGPGAPPVPPEIARFFADPTPKTRTIRGAPGSGKTTFALTTLIGFDGHRVYVSSSVPRASFARQFPWLDRSADRAIDFLEMLRYQTPTKDPPLRVDQMREVLEARANDLVDLAAVLSLPTSLYRALEAHPGGPKMVVVDSWEGWLENLLGGSSASLDVWTTRWVLERSVLDQILRTGAHVLMVVERDDRNRFDYIVDGAVSLSATEFEGREERWIALSKLRGSRIGNPSYPFTLDGAQFRCIAPMTDRLSFRTLRSDADPDPTLPTLWPGSTPLAARFGRLPTRGTLLLETDGETPLGVDWLLVAPMVHATLRSGGRVLLRPPAGFPIGELWRTLSTSVDEDRARTGLRFAEVVAAPDRGTVPAEVLLDSAEYSGVTEGGRRAAAIDFLRRGPAVSAPNLVVIFPHTEFDPGVEGGVTDAYLGLPSAARRAGASLASVVILRTDDPHIGVARVRSVVHLFARARRGQFFLYGIRPWTPLFVLDVPTEDAPGRSPYDLIPVV